MPSDLMIIAVIGLTKAASKRLGPHWRCFAYDSRRTLVFSFTGGGCRN
jgi:hypothetical protein